MFYTLISSMLLLAAATAGEIPLVTFDGVKETSHEFKELNDPVMGGKSTGTWTVDVANKLGVFNGEVVDVPKLKAPGFITTASDGRFPDVSAALGGDFVLRLRTTTPEFRGFRFSFASGTVAAAYSCAGGGSLPFSRGCFKSHAFNVTSDSNGGFAEIRLPISSFSDKWDPATGKQTTACTADSDVCPTAKTLKGINRVQLWAEGAPGKVHLEVQSISIAGAEAPLAATGGPVGLVTFDGASGTTFEFKALDDPVMGGKSTGTWTVDAASKVGVFDGEVVDVPSLKAPGFIKAASDGKFADVSAVADGAFVLKVRTTTPEYRGFRFSFASGAMSTNYACAGGGNLPFSRGCFKSHAFNVSGSENGAFVEVRLPISSFSDKWSSATGEQTKTCAEDSDVCPTAAKLKAIQRVEIWAEGALGKVHLEIQSISVVGADGTMVALSPATADRSQALPPQENDACQGAVQEDLRFNISSRTTPETLAQYVNSTESLAEAVCCDRRAEALAEPQFTFLAPDIQLWSHLDESGVTTFYDSVCGVPVFRAPVGRTLAEFKADTEEHGWPSFREAEVVADHVKTDASTGYVTSTCGTHLGSFLPDDKGKRWCIDLACVAGKPQ